MQVGHRFLLKAAILGFSGLATASFAADVGSINGKGITEQEFKDAVNRLGPQADMVKNNPEIRQQFFDHFVNSRLLATEAEKSGVDKTPAFSERMNEIRREVLAKMYVDQYIDKKADEKALKEYFEANKANFASKEIKASHILMKDEKEAAKILEEAKKKGADFAALAKKHSTDPGAANGGDLGFFGHGRMVPEFEKAAFETPKDTVHPTLVKSRFGYHIIKVTDIRGDEKADFAKVKPQVTSQLKGKLQEDLMKEARAKNNVKVDEGALKGLKF